MAQPPSDIRKNGPSNPELAAEIARLHAELHDVRDRLSERVKALEGRLGDAIKAAGDAGSTAASAQKTAGAAHEVANAAHSAAGAAHEAANAAHEAAGAAYEVANAAGVTATDAAARAQSAEAGAAAAERRAGEAIAAIDAVKGDVVQAVSGIKELRDAFGDDPAALPPRAAKLAAFLAVPVRDVTFDPVAERAIAAVLAARKADVDKLARDIVAGGIATDINKVSQRLGRARMSEARRHILAVAYPDLLRSRLGDPVKPDLAKDPPGLADSLLADLDAQGGPLDAFAERVVEGSEKSMSLNLKDHERATLRQRVRDSL